MLGEQVATQEQDAHEVGGVMRAGRTLPGLLRCPVSGAVIYRKWGGVAPGMCASGETTLTDTSKGLRGRLASIGSSAIRWPGSPLHIVPSSRCGAGSPVNASNGRVSAAVEARRGAPPTRGSLVECVGSRMIVDVGLLGAVEVLMRAGSWLGRHCAAVPPAHPARGAFRREAGQQGPYRTTEHRKGLYR